MKCYDKVTCEYESAQTAEFQTYSFETAAHISTHIMAPTLLAT